MSARLNKYVKEHKEGMRWTVVHAGPWLAVGGMLLTFFLKVGWLQMPAWSGDLERLQQDINSLKASIESTNAKVGAANKNVDNLYTATGKLQRDMATAKANDDAHAQEVHKMQQQMNLLINHGLSGP